MVEGEGEREGEIVKGYQVYNSLLPGYELESRGVERVHVNGLRPNKP